MKLLVVCQAFDREHPVLGFFHRWVAAFAEHFEQIDVIALSVGEHALPGNVRVHTLGKERGGGRMAYIRRFYALLRTLDGQYDAVFVHMNPEYVVLAGLWWRLRGIPIGLWYNHEVHSTWLTLAAPLCRWLFHTSPYAATAQYARAKLMPAGIDTAVFKPHPGTIHEPGTLYFQGRVAPAKRVHVMLEAFSKLYQSGEAKRFTIVGPEDATYVDPLKEKYRRLVEQGAVMFKGPVANTETPTLFAAHEVSLNLTDDGNYDKTVLESLACGTPVIVSSRAFAGAPVTAIEQPDVESLIAGYRARKQFSEAELVHYVDGTHGLSALAAKLYATYQTQPRRLAS